MANATWTPPPLPDPSTLRNPLPFEPFPLIHIRIGKVRPVFKRGTTSAIYKTPLSGPVLITTGGVLGDEHAYEPHRSPDKAVHHYSSSHYPKWQEELPASAHLFKPGAFGENLFSAELDETNICIGDKVAIGEVVLEVSEPRSPCYKLNHRFEVKNMANRTQTLLRCGWLYRVLTPGVVNPGDTIRLLERPCPEWTVARVMFYLFLEKNNAPMMTQIVALPALGTEIRDRFQERLDKGMAEDQDGRMYGGAGDKMDTWNEYRLVEKRKETSRICVFVLEAVDSVDVVPVEPGSHVRLKLGGKLVRAYSVVGGTSRRFELGIAFDAGSRGGSKYMHEEARVGDVLTVGRITASFPLAREADRHIIFAGGVGITAFLVALTHLDKMNQRYELHFAVAEEVPFADRLRAFGSRAKIYNKSLAQRLDLSAVIGRADPATHIYCCGPSRLMDGVKSAAKSFGVPDSSLHFEEFTVTTSGDPFTAELKQSNKVVEVGPTQTLLDALKAAGFEVDSSCEVGNCGTCRVDVCAGRVEHKGTGLNEEEKEEGAMLSCVSRGIGRIVLDL
ncbi:PK beta-barrel-protein domain-containing protein-like protein [Exidia glandulosa HHB12029]|uniref:PK beta-barrel-protein domain-containing protein-like protein n=1 Tax=Exidia glandulosa HHB12029 TaxID=1314781 RepID=A0A165QI09_EXIGL|nr:PK beta-barrel-protein domain-containing protein-like protein [Exidia glandulosa HHB12029]